jgi:hypothetical protein
MFAVQSFLRYTIALLGAYAVAWTGSFALMFWLRDEAPR